MLIYIHLQILCDCNFGMSLADFLIKIYTMGIYNKINITFGFIQYYFNCTKKNDIA